MRCCLCSHSSFTSERPSLPAPCAFGYGRGRRERKRLEKRMQNKMACELNEKIHAENLLEKLALRNALLLVGGFDGCDPCLRSIVKDKAVARRLAEEWVEEYIASTDSGADDDDSSYEDEIKDSFGFDTFLLAESTTRERELLAEDMVRDSRICELEDMVAGSSDNATIPD